MCPRINGLEWKELINELCYGPLNNLVTWLWLHINHGNLVNQGNSVHMQYKVYDWDITMLQCNAVSHWLSLYPEWSLPWHYWGYSTIPCNVVKSLQLIWRSGTCARSSNELQWLDLQIGCQDGSVKNGYKGNIPCSMDTSPNCTDISVSFVSSKSQLYLAFVNLVFLFEISWTIYNSEGHQHQTI